MLAIRTTYDGKEIHIPEDAKGIPPCRVIVLFEEDEASKDSGWLKAQEQRWRMHGTTRKTQFMTVHETRRRILGTGDVVLVHFPFS